MAKKLSGFTSFEVKNTASGGAIGTSYAALTIVTETGSLDWEPYEQETGGGQIVPPGGLLKGEVEFLDGASANATLANLRTDIANYVLCTVKATAVDGCTYEIASVYLRMTDNVAGKAGEFKKYKLMFQKAGTSYSSVVTEA